MGLKPEQLAEIENRQKAACLQLLRAKVDGGRAFGLGQPAKVPSVLPAEEAEAWREGYVEARCKWLKMGGQAAKCNWFDDEEED